MKHFLKALLIFLFVQSAYCAETLSITAVNPIPAKVVFGSTITGIVYSVKNNSTVNSYRVGFVDLTGQGITYTTTCGTLAAGASCSINMSFAATEESGIPLGPYVHWFSVTGAPKPAGYPLRSTIIPAGSDVTPAVKIAFNTSATSSSLFDVTLTGANTYTCSNLAFGTSNFCEAIVPGNYDVSISPGGVAGSDGNYYYGPATFLAHVTTNGQLITLTYTKSSNVEVSTDITAPNYSGTGVSVEMKGSIGTYTHDQMPGTHVYDTMPPGSYEVKAATYTGTDSETYIPSVSNPVVIDSTHNLVSITYAEQPPVTQHVNTVIVAPSLPTGSTVAIGATCGTNTYNHNQPAGTHTYDVIPDGECTLTAANYEIGQDTYEATLTNPYAVDDTHQEFAISYQKVIPPSTRYDWHQSHLTAIKNANVFLVDWGGGSTTAPVTIGTNPPVNPWLNTKVMNYENGTPTPIQTSATVQGYPSYIAMGTVTSPNSTVTDQLKELKMDSSFHYEGNGAGNRGCYFDNAAGQTTEMSDTSGSVGTVNAGTYYIVAGYYQVNASGQAKFYKGTLNITSTGTNAYNIAVTYALDPTSNIASYVDPSIVKQFTFPANSTVTYSLTGPDFGSKLVAPTLNINSDSLCGSVWYTSGAYTPEVNQMAQQAVDTKAVNNHTLIPSEVFYTIDFSDGVAAITDDTMNDYNVKAHLYNLMYEAKLMQAQTAAGTQMSLFLNPDSVWLFQNCSQWNCPISWKKGITDDSTSVVISIPNLQADVDGALDRMQAKGFLTGSQVTTLKANLVSSGILTPPPASKRTTPGIPELALVNNWIMKQLAENVPFGWGLNVYDSANPYLNPTGQAQPWQTAAGTWVHKVNHIGLTPTSSTLTSIMKFVGLEKPYQKFVTVKPNLNDVLIQINNEVKQKNIPFNKAEAARALAVKLYGGKESLHDRVIKSFGLQAITSVADAINNDATMLANYLKDMNFVGNASGEQKPDYIYFDKYERDPIPGEIGSGWAWNGVDWDTYLLYIADTDALVDNIPVALWQMPGASIQVQGATFADNKAATIGMWLFGIPELNNDFSNWDSTQETADNVAWSDFYNTQVYFTKNSNVADLKGYLQLGAGSP